MLHVRHAQSATILLACIFAVVAWGGSRLHRDDVVVLHTNSVRQAKLAITALEDHLVDHEVRRSGRDIDVTVAADDAAVATDELRTVGIRRCPGRSGLLAILEPDNDEVACGLANQIQIKLLEHGARGADVSVGRTGSKVDGTGVVAVTAIVDLPAELRHDTARIRRLIARMAGTNVAHVRLADKRLSSLDDAPRVPTSAP